MSFFGHPKAVVSCATRVLVPNTSERRAFLSLSLGAFASLWMPWSGRSFARPHADELLWDDFVREVFLEATDIVAAQHPDEEGYLSRLDALLARVVSAPPASFTAGIPVDSAYSFQRFPFVAAQFSLAPWATIPCHDHRQYNGILKVLAGSVRVSTFELADEPEADGVFKIREVGDHVLAPGERSSLTRTRGNIHMLQAQGEGVLLLDLFTFFAEEGRSVYLDIVRTDCERCAPGTYVARWKD